MACGHLSLLLLLLGLSQVVVHAFFFSRERHWPDRHRGGELAGGFRRRAWGHDLFSHQHGRRSRLDSSKDSSEESSEESSKDSSEESSEESSRGRTHFRFVFRHGPTTELHSWMDSLMRRKEKWLRTLFPRGWHRPHLSWMSGSSGLKPRTSRCPLVTTRRPTTIPTTTPVPTLPSVASVATIEGVEEGSGVISEFEVRAVEELRKTARPFFQGKPLPLYRSTPKSRRENESGKFTRGKVDVFATTAKPTSATEEFYTLPEIVA